ncbi:MAG: Stealth CR1 domain-containing protein [Lachnospiraceae bacterium]|nr:Stealth CR1 domain-containing protein [Lachnospiraceae bacterium]
MTEGIDFVVTWVDGSDENWRRQKAEYSRTKETDDSEERYRDWGLLKYWFRGVEQYAPWVRKVHLITWGHLPKWLDTDHPKLHIVRHEDYIPEQFLPTFNSNVLELYLHRIEGLSERFVYFNDDMYLIRNVKPEDFFTGDRPNDMLAFQPVVANPANPVMSHLYLNNSLVLCKYFDKRENVKRQPGNYFKIGYPPLYFFYNMLELAFPLYTGFYTVHGPSAFLKSTFREIWEKEETLLTEVSGNRFRSNTDVTPYLFREWQKLSGNFKAKNIQRDFRYFNIMEDRPEMYRTIRKGKCNVVCLNDGPASLGAEDIKEKLLDAFRQIMPEKSSFERI